MRRGVAALSVCLVVALGTGPSGPAGASALTRINCDNGEDLQAAINATPVGWTLRVAGRCVGNFRIKRSITLEGVHSATLDARGSGAALTIHRGTVVLRNLTITGGNALLGGGLRTNGDALLYRVRVTGNIAQHGGGIENDGGLRLEESSVSGNGNGTTYDGAQHPEQGILNTGTLTLVDSSVNQNQGGGIYSPAGSIEIERSTIDGNEVGGARAAGLENEGIMTITDSTISNGLTEYDGTPGIFNLGTMNISFSTISGNTGFNNNSGGGGIENGGALNVTSSTITNNSSDAITGSGIANGDPLDGLSPGTVKISATILAGNIGGDCLGPITSEGFNLVGTLFGYPPCNFKEQKTDIRGGKTSSIDPRLRSLGSYGGPTQTMPPRQDSVVVDVIPIGARSTDRTINLCPDPDRHSVDQRGFPRPALTPIPRCEIGSVEVLG